MAWQLLYSCSMLMKLDVGLRQRVRVALVSVWILVGCLWGLRTERKVVTMLVLCR